MDIEIYRPNYVRSHTQQKMKIKHKVWALSTLKKSKEKTKRVRRNGQKVRKQKHCSEEVVNNFINMGGSAE